MGDILVNPYNGLGKILRTLTVSPYAICRYIVQVAVGCPANVAICRQTDIGTELLRIMAV